MRARRNDLSRTVRYAPAVVVLVASLGLSLWSWRAVMSGARAAEEQKFFAQADEVAESIEARMDTYVTALLGARGLFAVTETLDPQDFGRFVREIEIQRNYPGIQGIGYARRLPASALDAFEAARRAAGDPGYRVWPRTGGEQFPIDMLEPRDERNRRALGFDMTTEPVRRLAMERARDSGEPSLSRRVWLVQESELDRQPGILLYLADYGGRTPHTVAERRAALRGYIYAPFRMRDLVGESMREVSGHHLRVEIYDAGGEDRGPPELLYATDRTDPITQETSRTVRSAGRDWSLRVGRTEAAMTVAEQSLGWATLAAGIAISLLLFGVALEQTRTRAAAERASRRSAFLAYSGRALARTLDEDDTARAAAGLVAAALAPWGVVTLQRGGGRVVHMAGTDLLRTVGISGEVPPAFHTARPTPATGKELAQRLGVDPSGAWDGARLCYIALPLAPRGEPIGALHAVRDASNPFSRADFLLVEEFSRMAAVAVENARLYREAREAVALRDEFLGVASHELRTPLTSLRLQLHRALRLLEQPGEAAKLRGVVEASERQARRMTGLVDGLLDVSRIAHGKLSLELEMVNLTDTASEVASRLSEQFSAAGSPFTLVAPAPVVGHWDRLRLEQVLTNLLSNAAKYGRGRPVEMRVWADGHEAHVTVRDEGIGLAPEDARRVFDRFERAVSVRHYAGLGLGLYITRQIVMALGGEVSVESELRRGSTFFVRLPLAGPPEMRSPAGHEATGGARETNEGAAAIT